MRCLDGVGTRRQPALLICKHQHAGAGDGRGVYCLSRLLPRAAPALLPRPALPFREQVLVSGSQLGEVLALWAPPPATTPCWRSRRRGASGGGVGGDGTGAGRQEARDERSDGTVTALPTGG